MVGIVFILVRVNVKVCVCKFENVGVFVLWKV